MTGTMRGKNKLGGRGSFAIGWSRKAPHGSDISGDLMEEKEQASVNWGRAFTLQASGLSCEVRRADGLPETRQSQPQGR